MIKQRVKASKSYYVYVGRGILRKLGELMRKKTAACRIVLVTDDIVDSLYGAEVRESLEEAGFLTSVFTVKHGEGAKSMECLVKLLDFLCEMRLTRTDMLVALGGGVVGDLTGFAASVYLRGIRFVQVPTTLLAAVDSSVGGKTAVNLNAGKNLAGTFYQPDVVYCDPEALRTLPQEIYADGCAEIIKYGILEGGVLISLIKEGIRKNEEKIIAECIRIKAAIVHEDEHDTGKRQLLNLGHTLGHAVERLSRYGVTHGSAVAIGMCMMARAAVAKGLCPDGMPQEIESLVHSCGLPDSYEATAEQLHEAALYDKKHTGDGLTLVIPSHIGDCMLYKVDDREFMEMIREAVGASQHMHCDDRPATEDRA